MDGEGLGSGFWFKFAGVLIGGAIVMFIIIMLFTRAAAAWGAFGAFLVLAGIAILAGWIHDRRDKRSDNEADYRPPPKLRG